VAAFFIRAGRDEREGIMNRLLLVPVALGLILAAAPARAQYPGYTPYPTGGLGAYSPYTTGGLAGYSPYSTPYLYSRPQVPFPGAGGPRLSPFLNLLRNGTNPAVNYYLGVLPERERRRFEAGASVQLRGLEREVSTPAPVLVPEDEFAPNPSVTGGYVAVFNNTGGFFPTPGAAGVLPPIPRRTPTRTPAATTPTTPPKK
jgi:hypothetical protein